MHYSRFMLHRILIAPGCAFLILSGCARPATGVQMNASETPGKTAAAQTILPVSTIVVGPASTSVPLSQIKTATPAPTAKAGGTVNLQNAESGVTLHSGEGFLLDLGERGWKIRIEDESVVHQIEAAVIPVGSQGYFGAFKAGKTKMYATSDPPCRQATPPCMLPTLFVEIPITVLP